MMDPMKKAWEILKATDFQRFLVEVFGIPRAEARKLTASRSLKQSISQGELTEFITENEFQEIINLVESKQYEALMRGLEDINSRYLVSQQEKRNRLRNQRNKERRANDPEYREKRNRYYRERYANNPEVREKQRERDRKRDKEKRNRQRRERLANDPEYREKINRQQRESYRRKKERKE